MKFPSAIASKLQGRKDGRTGEEIKVRVRRTTGLAWIKSSAAREISGYEPRAPKRNASVLTSSEKRWILAVRLAEWLEITFRRCCVALSALQRASSLKLWLHSPHTQIRRSLPTYARQSVAKVRVSTQLPTIYISRQQKISLKTNESWSKGKHCSHGTNWSNQLSTCDV